MHNNSFIATVGSRGTLHCGWGDTSVSVVVAIYTTFSENQTIVKSSQLQNCDNAENSINFKTCFPAAQWSDN